MNTEKQKKLVKDSYSNWSENEHRLGFKVTYSEYEATDYNNWKDSDNPADWSYKVYQAKFQPKGYWSNVLTVEISKEGVNFSRSSGGDIGDIDGLEQMSNFKKALDVAQLYAVSTKKQIEKGEK